MAMALSLSMKKISSIQHFLLHKKAGCPVITKPGLFAFKRVRTFRRSC
jgi:hypothetical protein